MAVLPQLGTGIYAFLFGTEHCTCAGVVLSISLRPKLIIKSIIITAIEVTTGYMPIKMQDWCSKRQDKNSLSSSTLCIFRAMNYIQMRFIPTYCTSALSIGINFVCWLLSIQNTTSQPCLLITVHSEHCFPTSMLWHPWTIIYNLFYARVTFLELHNSVALVRERTIPTERPPPAGEVSANFYG